MPKGILMVGEPGVGKTLIARALANESNAYFEYIPTSLIQDSYQGSGVEKIKEIF